MIAKEIQDLKKKQADLKERLKDLLKNLPDVSIPGVQLVGDRAAIVSSKVIASHDFNLSPSYYLDMNSKKILLEMVERSSLETLPEKISSIIETGKLIYQRQNIKLSPSFIQELKKIWEV